MLSPSMRGGGGGRGGSRPVVCAGVAALATTALVAVACGGPSSETESTGRDAGVQEGGAGAPDGLAEAAALDAGGSPDAFAVGQHLVARPARFEGLTSDGYVVFSELTDRGTRVAEVIGLDGGGETTIATSTTTGNAALKVLVSGPVVFAWTDRDGGKATLTLWSSAAGVVAKGSDVRPGRGAASADGAYVAYVTAVAASTASLVFGPIASATPATVATLDTTNLACWQTVDMAFVGTASSARFLSFFCPSGSTSFTVRSVDPSDGGAVDLTTSAVGETFGKNVVLFEDATGLLASTAADGSHPVTLAANASAFALSNDEASAVWQTTTASIVTSPVASAAPRIAAAAGAGAQIGPLSPDGNRVLFASALADGGSTQVALYTDVQLATLADDGGATVRALVPSPTSCSDCLTDSFTPDTTHAMALDPIDNSQAAGGTGPLHVFPLDGGADWTIGANLATVVALGKGTGAGSRFLFIGATDDATVENGFAYEMYLRSLAASDTPSEIARDVEWLTTDEARTTVVYSIPGSGELGGVWVAPLE